MKTKKTVKKGITSLSTLVLMSSIIIGNTFSTSAIANQDKATQTASQNTFQTQHKTININGVDIFYREAGPVNAPSLSYYF